MTNPAEQERAAIVAWLRDGANKAWVAAKRDRLIADAIEACDHHRSKTDGE